MILIKTKVTFVFSGDTHSLSAVSSVQAKEVSSPQQTQVQSPLGVTVLSSQSNTTQFLHLSWLTNTLACHRSQKDTVTVGHYFQRGSSFHKLLLLL